MYGIRLSLPRRAGAFHAHMPYIRVKTAIVAQDAVTAEVRASVRYQNRVNYNAAGALKVFSYLHDVAACSTILASASGIVAAAFQQGRQSLCSMRAQVEDGATKRSRGMNGHFGRGCDYEPAHESIDRCRWVELRLCSAARPAEGGLPKTVEAVIMSVADVLLPLIPPPGLAADESSLAVQPSPKLTLLVKSRWPVSNTMGVSFTRGIASVSLAFKHCMQDCFAARF